MHAVGEDECRRRVGRDEVRARAQQRRRRAARRRSRIDEAVRLGLARISLNRPKMLTRIVGTPRASRPPISVELKSDDTALNCAGCPDAVPPGVRPMSGRLNTMTLHAPAASRMPTCWTRLTAAAATFGGNSAGVIAPADSAPSWKKTSFAPPHTAYSAPGSRGPRARNCATWLAIGVAVPVGAVAGTPGRLVTRAPPAAKLVPP